MMPVNDYNRPGFYSVLSRRAAGKAACHFLKCTTMPLTVIDKSALVKQILLASSREEVRILIEKNFAFASLSYMEMVAGELGSFSPMHEQVQQWSNIRVAKIFIFRMMKQAKKN